MTDLVYIAVELGSGARFAKALKDNVKLARRLGLLLCQLVKSSGIRGARINYRGEVASKPTKLITASFTAPCCLGGSVKATPCSFSRW